MSKKKKGASTVPAPEVAQALPAAPESAAPTGADTPGPAPEASAAGPVGTALKLWLSAYKVELILFVVSFAVLAAFSSQRFLRQSEAPHFVWQAKAWLEGRLDLDPDIIPEANVKPGQQVRPAVGRMPIMEDYACVRVVAGKKIRCEGNVIEGDRFFSSFPWFPSVPMLPFVALHGYQFNDTSFGVFVGALAIALFYSLLRLLAKEGETDRTQPENIALALVLGFGTLFFYCAIRGEVWFSAEVMGVALTCLYVRNSLGARRPLLAGLFYSMAVLTRTPLAFAGIFFVLEALCPGPTGRLEQLKKITPERWRKLGLFAAGAAPLALIAALYNYARFDSFTEFGHRFIYFNAVTRDIDAYGLFNPHYLFETFRGPGNLKAAFGLWPNISLNPLSITYDPNGLSLLLTLPLILFLVVPRARVELADEQVKLSKYRRLHWPLWLTVAATALPGFFYQNNGYMQFGYRFSLDYTPYLLLLFAIGNWKLKNRWVQAAIAVGVLVNFWGAVAFRGYTELMRH
jgi:hypothetical protein